MIVVVFLLALFLVILLTGREMRFVERSANDIPPFLRKIDMEAVYGTFHPEAEEELRSLHSAKEFRQLQWRRFHLAIHYSRDLTHNSMLFQAWARYERRHNWSLLNPALQEAIRELSAKGLLCRLASFYVRLRLRWWLVRMAILPFTRVPSFHSLLRHGGADMIAFYDTARALAEAFSQAYGDDYYQKLSAAL
jgi:hypothetical protein